MTTQLCSARSPLSDRKSREMNGESPCVKGLGRLIPVALALYLTPVLLMVLIVGGVGMLVLAVARAFTTIVKGSDSSPLNSGRRRSPLI